MKYPEVCEKIYDIGALMCIYEKKEGEHLCVFMKKKKEKHAQIISDV